MELSLNQLARKTGLETQYNSTLELVGADTGRELLDITFAENDVTPFTVLSSLRQALLGTYTVLMPPGKIKIPADVLPALGLVEDLENRITQTRNEMVQDE